MTRAQETRVLAFIGDPVGQARSPAILNELFERAGSRTVVVPLRVPAGELVDVLPALFRAGNVHGAVLTNPHKSAALRLAKPTDRWVRAAGGANAVRRGETGLEAAMFDGVGAVKALRRQGFALAHRRTLVVGAGQAGMAIAAALLREGLRGLSLFDLDPARSARVARELTVFTGTGVVATTRLDLGGHDLVVNATSLGTDSDDPLPFLVESLDRDAAVFDVVAREPETALVRACREAGHPVVGGREMLLEQIAEFVEFFGLHADIGDEASLPSLAPLVAVR